MKMRKILCCKFELNSDIDGSFSIKAPKVVTIHGLRSGNKNGGRENKKVNYWTALDAQWNRVEKSKHMKRHNHACIK